MTSINFQTLSDKEFNTAKNIFAAFYSYDENGKLNILLKKETTQNEYSLISAEKTLADHTPIIGISRVLATEYRGLLSKNTLTQDESSTSEFILNKENLTWYELIQNPSFQKWVHVFTNNPIQYDLIKDNLVYFHEINYLNLEKFNKELDSLDYKYRFAYLQININSEDSEEENFNSNSILIDPLTEKLLKTIGNIQNFIDDSILTEESDKYVVISCINRDVKGYDDWGYWLDPSIFFGLYRKNKEKWYYMRGDLGKFPDDSILMNNCKGIIFPGSSLHIYDDITYVNDTIKWIKEFISNENYKNIKIFGICFGHQMIANSYGIEVRQRPSGECIERVEQLDIDDTFWELNFVKNSGIKQNRKEINIYQIHSDEINPTVDQLANIDVKLLATSKTCDFEMCLYEGGRILSFQGHPEDNPEFSLFNQAKLFYDEAGCDEDKFNQLIDGYMKEYLSLYNYENDMVYVTYSFLRHEL